MNALYNLVIYVYALSIKISALWNAKARKWVDGRKNIFIELEKQFNKGEKIIWFHCSSLGEFEQARPVIELFKERNTTYKILLTFFSPSGYEIRKSYSEADYVFYLPSDTAANAKRFIELVKPSILVIAKYDFWFNYLQELQKNNIPTIVFSALFRRDHYFFHDLGFWFREILSGINMFYVQDDYSRKILRKNRIDHAVVCGDTRFDRVMKIAQQPAHFPLLEKFTNTDKTVFIAGSTWPEDERLIFELIKKRKASMKFIIAPHEINDKKIEKFRDEIDQPILRYSLANETNIDSTDILIIDSIGILAQIYRYADVAYVGGGFGKGIHNILEPAAYSIPIIFGPNYTKFIEADEMVNFSMAFTVDKFRALNNKITDLFFEKRKINHLKERMETFMKERTGATETVVFGIEKFLSAAK